MEPRRHKNHNHNEQQQQQQQIDSSSTKLKMVASTITTAVVGKGRRPLVVLAGWLGSQPKSLRRYQELYRKIGFDVVLTYIAPPHAVVQTVFQSDDPILVPPGWPNTMNRQQHCVTTKSAATIQGLAWDILRDVAEHHDYCSSFYFHGFSNGGCFVWEKLRQILLFAPPSIAVESDASFQHAERTAKVSSADTTADILSSLRDKLAGVVFDSSPIAELNRLDEALKHCSWIERANVIRYCGLDYMFMKDDPDIQARVQRRTDAYVTGLREDPLLIPQLYLYCRDDPLAPAPLIDELVAHRRGVVGSDRVIRRVWDKSVHCSHLLKHPQEYTAAVEAFVELGESDKRRRSKL